MGFLCLCFGNVLADFYVLAVNIIQGEIEREMEKLNNNEEPQA